MDWLKKLLESFNLNTAFSWLFNTAKEEAVASVDGVFSGAMKFANFLKTVGLDAKTADQIIGTVATTQEGTKGLADSLAAKAQAEAIRLTQQAGVKVAEATPPAVDPTLPNAQGAAPAAGKA